MKKVALGLVLAVVATSAIAGALVDPIVETEVIVNQTSSSSIAHDIIPPLFFLFMVGVPFIAYVF